MKSSGFSKLIVMALALAALVAQLTGCGEVLKKPVSEPFYGRVAPPAAQEIRWSNGNLPKSFDPAKVSAAPETDIVRAIYEGLTDLDAATLDAIPAISAGWTASDDFRTWTFQLRTDARWTNDEKVTAHDFVRSWRRVVEQAENAPHHRLFDNIVGALIIQNSKLNAENQSTETATPETQKPEVKTDVAQSKDQNQKTEDQTQIKNQKSKIKNPDSWFGVEAVNDFVLRVYLIEPDKDFPKLAAHPAFRPVYQAHDDLEKLENAPKLVTNGAFRVAAADKNGITIERSKNYWNAERIALERIKFVPVKDAESALNAYQAGEVDVVTNANFEPLAVKLLASYEDLRRTPFNAVTFYEFNSKKSHFADKRVREALALSIDRERLASDEMDDTVIPATSFLPASPNQKFKFEPEKAKKLLADAGFSDAQNFPKLRLLINRNDAQRRLAKSIATMWRKNLGIETEIVVSSFEEIETARQQGDFDLIKRSVVLPTTDETANFMAVLKHEDADSTAKNDQAKSVEPSKETNASSTDAEQSAAEDYKPKIIELLPKRLDEPLQRKTDEIAENETTASELQENVFDGEQFDLILSEAEALEELPAIPLYFPSSYALVKPYVKGFETNLLDAPSFKNIQIETAWQAK